MNPLPSEDVLNAVAGLAPDSAVAALRARRPAFVQHTQGSHDVLVATPGSGSLPAGERARVALLVAELSRHPALAAHYATLVTDRAPPPPGSRLAAVLRHAELVTLHPGQATASDIAALRDAGLSPLEIVTLSQIIAFVSYQARIAFGLRLLAEEAAA